jgi:hypothetical protein
MATSAKPKPSFIDPNRLYALAGFLQCSGINQTRVRALRLAGIDLPKLRVGKRVFIRGCDGIEYIERAAKL